MAVICGECRQKFPDLSSYLEHIEPVHPHGPWSMSEEDSRLLRIVAFVVLLVVLVAGRYT